MNKLYILLLFFAILASCQSSKLEQALRFAGNNRLELERVLEHYRDSTLKYEAACFLIENMPPHYSYRDTTRLHDYYNKVDSIVKLDSIYKSYTLLSAEYNNIQFEFVPDVQYVTAEYLINNIEKAFDLWLNGEWAQHVSFEDFCEYLLPYKVVECQFLDDWREYLSCYGGSDLENLKYCDLQKNSTYCACVIVTNDLKNHITYEMSDDNEKSHIPKRKMQTITQIPHGKCDDYVHLVISTMRAKGIPTIIDYTPQWPFRSMGHTWSVLLNDLGTSMAFDISDSNWGLPHKIDHKFAKIFRKTYSINRDIEEIHRIDKYVPATFSNVCFKDVTDKYADTKDIKVTINKPLDVDSKYAYLAVFDNKEWVPVHWGKIKGNEVLFTNMGKDVVYLPVCYGKNGIYPISSPFLLTKKGEVLPFHTDSPEKQILVLNRKYPFLHSSDNISRLLLGEIQASDYKDFRDYKTLYTIEESAAYFKEISLNSKGEVYRYWRYYPPKGAWCNIAELAFFEANSGLSLNGRIIGTEGSFEDYPYTLKETVFDGNPLTFFYAPYPDDCWVGMDFGEKVNINKIRYLPRGDGNCIEIGDEYELLFWGDKSWESLGRKIADDISITFEECPVDVLFLLRNHTKGREERIFAYKNEEQIWW